MKDNLQGHFPSRTPWAEKLNVLRTARFRGQPQSAADSEARTFQERVPSMASSWTACSQQKFQESDWPRLVRGRGLDTPADCARTRTNRGRGRGLDKATASWPDFAGRVPATARTLRWKSRGRFAGCCVVCQLDANVDASCPPSELPRGLQRQLPGRFLAVAPTVARTFPSVAWDSYPATARTQRGCCRANARMIHRLLRGRFARCFVGCCADIARLAATPSCKGMVSDQNERLSNSRKPPEITFA